MTVASCGALAVAVSAHASFAALEFRNKLVFDSGHYYNVFDVYAVCTGQFDRIAMFAGQSTSDHGAVVRTIYNGVANAGDAANATNGAPFAQAAGTGWMPDAAADSVAWDSFVTMGSRVQSHAASMQAITPGPYFVNGFTTGADTLQGGYDASSVYVGPGWYAATPNTTESSASAWVDRRLMLGRFSIDVTNLDSHGTLGLQIRGQLSMRVNGTSFGTGTTAQYWVDNTYTLGWVPCPSAMSLVGLAGVVSRRRRL
jgi:hypothetical protein